MEKNTSDTYKTLASPSREILFKEKKSKFYGYAFPLADEADVKPIIDSLRKKHHTAGHICYAWQLGTVKPRFRANDDGEPNNSAGMPIYGQIQAVGLTNVLVVVVRIFGGTKLGIGGLIQAYRTTAQMVLAASNIVEKIRKQKFLLSFDYAHMDKVMRIIKQHQLEILSQKLHMNCSFVIAVRNRKVNQIEEIFGAVYQIGIRKLD
ncbi:MAG: YigZ family protein [Saonia sp.]